MKFMDIVKKRKSVKKFAKKEPDWRAIIECIDAARYAPSTGGINHMKYILIRDKKKIQMLAELAEQDFFQNVSYVVVVCSQPSRIIDVFPENGERFSSQQAGAAIENFLLALEEKALSTCWIGHFNERRVKGLLGIPEDSRVEALFPIGFAFKDEKPKRKADLNSILYFDSWEKKKMKTFRKLDV